MSVGGELEVNGNRAKTAIEGNQSIYISFKRDQLLGIRILFNTTKKKRLWTLRWAERDHVLYIISLQEDAY
ncbi:hypothetical protein [Planococcus salinus]|uniref:Uncharacterized protein n=1 Tax=Planococcus salinus TaxID=1848460 RepID=A0A3M8P858_9BACL|nr:hypothetical protein [Planococcus salinus]RNF39611.1 hypothetical protein EEX84_09065 [Planococcus salinus]